MALELTTFVASMWMPLDGTIAHCIGFVDFLICCIVSFARCIVSSVALFLYCCSVLVVCLYNVVALLFLFL